MATIAAHLGVDALRERYVSGLRPSRRAANRRTPRLANPGRDPLKIRGELSKQLEPALRLERTHCTLDWISDPALRRRTNAGLNKSEARNALARAVFFHRLGEIRDRTFENQRCRASCLNLVVSAVILWNTVYLSHAVGTALQRRTSP